MSFARFVRKILAVLIPDRLVYVLWEEASRKRCQHQKRLLRSCGSDFYLASNVVINSPTEITFGDRCAVNEFVHILAGGGVTIGNGVWIASHASIITVSHPKDVEFIGHHPNTAIPVSIEDNVWIGSHAVIMPGVKLGRSSIVGAGAVVTKDVPPYAIVAGVPAKILQYKTLD